MRLNPRPRRSALYIPGANDRAIAKSPHLDADILIFDLEDSVHPTEKARARDQVASLVRTMDKSRAEIVIRVNALSTPWAKEDISVAAASGADAILLFSKIRGAEDIHEAAAELDASHPVNLALWAMMETPSAILNAASIAATARTLPLGAMVMGTNDLAAALHMPADVGRLGMQGSLTMVQLAARAEGLAILDGTFNSLNDHSGLAEQCMQGRRLGMDGKTLIHPTQIAVANEAFAPTSREIAWAKQIVDAFAHSRRTEVLNIDGQMIERLQLAAASRTIQLANSLSPVPPSGNPPS